ncbi:MAG: hypothetical protein COS99_06310 [Candidatus Omnitrophica bacterium CG07_land_8_20_14_0_80_42_15]|uniref:Secondary thiamine-phosphate synthase enzyme n=1 Tax=Candidatus Aquitaenariimonas noxiae TaxID=1974741 RepID=A0A2J0KSE1_9BACT|nr:MAG: hypothetical protein COS99_06310 [Candidatus Omnitrophica bacterium CG07_land_8_20_14_0_80_42_15]
MIEELSVGSSSKVDAIDITARVASIVNKGKVKDGVCRLFIPHTTAGILINEHADPSVIEDILMELNKAIPAEDGYSHAEGNSSAHIKSSLIGHSLDVFIEDGNLKLGTWQGIFFCEFDGPRKRKIWIKVSSDH